MQHYLMTNHTLVTRLLLTTEHLPEHPRHKTEQTQKPINKNIDIVNSTR